MARSVGVDGSAGPAPGWPMSLLWPEDELSRRSVPVSTMTAQDLALEPLVAALDVTGRHAGTIRAVLCQLCVAPDTIVYRQAILDDLLGAPALADGLLHLLPELVALSAPAAGNWPGESPLVPVMGRLAELDRYVACIDHLHAVLEGASGLQSAGLCGLRGAVARLAADPDVAALRAELPGLRESIGEAASVTIGLNLSRDLQPEGATIVSFNAYKFKGQRSLLGRLLPDSSTQQAPTGVAPLHAVGPPALRHNSQLYQDLQHLLETITAPLARALTRYRDLNVRLLAALERELAFYLGAVHFVSQVRAAGIPLCRPTIAAPAERAFAVSDMVNLSLALQMMKQRSGAALDGTLVANDARFDETARLLVVTGPNRGGKTTFCRAVGQAQLLFQCGLPVPGSAARISPVDGIWTHFPLPETDRPGAGRLDEEVRRLRQIFDEATDASLILLNEPLTSTSERDALLIAIDLVRGLQLLGGRAVLVTHLHELALAIPELNRGGPPGYGIQSLVAQAALEGQRTRGTFRIVAGEPAGHSYAVEIARQHGLTYPELEALLQRRAKASGQLA